MKVDEIKVRGVRGIRSEISLKLGGRSLLLHGDNGTGKSSVERALRWALLGEEEPTDEAPYTSESSFRRHVLVAADEPRVQVTFKGGGSIEVSPGNSASDRSGERVRNSCKRGVPFLRRTELLNVLSSRPVDRFRYFEGFLGLEKIDSLLKELGDSKSNAERRKTSLETSLSNQLGALTPFLPHEMQQGIGSGSDLEGAALEWAKRLGLSDNDSDWEKLVQKAESVTETAPDDLERKRATLGSCSASVET